MSINNEIKWGNFKNPLIITGGIGILISLVLLVSSNITGSVFIGLVSITMASCFVVAFKSSIESFKATVNGLSVKFKDQENKIKAIAIKQSEPPKITGMSASLPSLTGEAYGTNDKTQAVIKSIGGTKYTFRNIEGIVTDSKLPEDIAKDNLNWLILNNLADVFDIDGEKMYALSHKGHVVFQNTIKENKKS